MEPIQMAVLAIVSSPEIFVYTLLGTIGGIIVGAIPGLTATMAVAVLIPFTFRVEPIVGLASLCGIYIGGIYGGSISAILLRIPGTPSSAFTTLDGYPMALRGEAGRAISIATMSSFVGGFISILFLITTAPYIVKVALNFSDPEFFAIAVWGLASVADVSGNKLVYGLMSAAIGIFLGFAGLDPMTGAPRFTLGIDDLQSGLEFVPIMIGLFGMSEVLNALGKSENGVRVSQRITNLLPDWQDVRRNAKTWVRGTLIGIWVGVLPGATGGAMGSLMAYNAEKSLSPNSAEFGKGAPEGIAASESANNATVGGSLVPLLTLGIPGDTITALMIGAFMMHNLRPGPLLYQQNPDLVHGVYGSLILAHVFMLVLGLLAARVFAKVLDIPRPILLALVVTFCTVGAFAVSNSLFNILVMVVFGFMGYFLERIGMPVTPMLIGLVLGPMAESSLRSGLQMFEGDVIGMLTRPFSLFFLLLSAAMIILPRLKDLRKRSRSISRAKNM